MLISRPAETTLRRLGADILTLSAELVMEEERSAETPTERAPRAQALKIQALTGGRRWSGRGEWRRGKAVGGIRASGTRKPT